MSLFLADMLILFTALSLIVVINYIPYGRAGIRDAVKRLLWGVVFVAVVTGRLYSLEGEINYLPFFYITPLSQSMQIYPALIGIMAVGQRDNIVAVLLSLALMASSPVMFGIFSAIALFLAVPLCAPRILIPFIVLPACLPVSSSVLCCGVFLLSFFLTSYSFSYISGPLKLTPFIVTLYFIDHIFSVDRDTLSLMLLLPLMLGGFLIGLWGVLGAFAQSALPMQLNALTRIWYFMVMETSLVSFMVPVERSSFFSEASFLEIGTPLFMLLGLLYMTQRLPSSDQRLSDGPRQPTMMRLLVGAVIGLVMGCACLSIAKLQHVGNEHLIWGNIRELPMDILINGALFIALISFYCLFVRLLYRTIAHLTHRQLLQLPCVLLGVLACVTVLTPGLWNNFMNFNAPVLPHAPSLKYLMSLTTLTPQDGMILYRPFWTCFYGAFFIAVIAIVVFAALKRAKPIASVPETVAGEEGLGACVMSLYTSYLATFSTMLSRLFLVCVDYLFSHYIALLMLLAVCTMLFEIYGG